MWWNLPQENQLWAVSTSHPVPKIETLFALICFNPDSAPVGTSLSALIWRTVTLIFGVHLPFLAIVPMVEATRSYPDNSNCEAQEEEFPGSFCKQLYFLPEVLPTKGGGCPRRWPVWLSFPGTFPVLALRFPKENPSVLGKLAHPTTVWSYTNKQKNPISTFPWCINFLGLL